MTRSSGAPAHSTATTVLCAAGSVVGSAGAVAGLCSALAWALTTSTDVRINAAGVAVLGALLGVMAATPVRLPLERGDAAGHGFVIVLVGMLLTAALVTAMGLAVLAAVTAAGCAAHAVQVRPTKRQMMGSSAMAALTAAAAWGAQFAGWVEGIIDPGNTAVVMIGLLTLMCPQIANAASISRRAAAAAELLDLERRRHEEVLQHAADHDALTGLLSRRGLAAPLTNAAASAGPGHLTGVLFMDLDGFKTVNDVYGHGAGDELLRELSASK